MTKSETISKRESLRSMLIPWLEKNSRIKNPLSSMLIKTRSSSRKKRLTRKLKKWKHFARSKKMRDVREKPRTRKLSKPNKPKSRRRWTWILQQNMCRENGTGSKPRVSS